MAVMTAMIWSRSGRPRSRPALTDDGGVVALLLAVLGGCRGVARRAEAREQSETAGDDARAMAGSAMIAVTRHARRRARARARRRAAARLSGCRASRRRAARSGRRAPCVRVPDAPRAGIASLDSTLRGQRHSPRPRTPRCPRTPRADRRRPRTASRAPPPAPQHRPAVASQPAHCAASFLPPWSGARVRRSRAPGTWRAIPVYPGWRDEPDVGVDADSLDLDLRAVVVQAMMTSDAEKDAVGEVGAPAVSFPPADVVHFCPRGRRPAARAALVAEGDGGLRAGRNSALVAPPVEHGAVAAEHRRDHLQVDASRRTALAAGRCRRW